jgi:hypothetical protein
VALQEPLESVTQHWTSSTVARTYQNNEAGHSLLAAEVAALGNHGYAPTTSSGDGGHINIGRTLGGAALTGGLSLFFGGSRTNGTIVVTYTRPPAHDAEESKADAIDDLINKARADVFATGVFGWSGVKVAAKSSGARGIFATTVWYSGTVTNGSDEAFDELVLEIAVAIHPRDCPDFQVHQVVLDDADPALPGCVIPSHRGSKLMTFEFHLHGPVLPGEAKAFHWEHEVPKGALFAMTAWPTRLRRGAIWTGPRPCTMDEMAAAHRTRRDIERTAKEHAGMKACPDCAEWVREEARICRFCRCEF